MRAVTLRRLMVYGVCLLGIGALYLVPSLARTPDRVSRPALPEDPASVRPTQTVSTPTVSAPAPLPTATTTTTTYVESPTTGERFPRSSTESKSEAPADRSSVPRAERSSPVATRAPQSSRSSARGPASPFVSAAEDDNNPPEPVTDLELRAATEDQLTLGWAPGTDDVGILRYRVWLDGYEVQTTSDTEATLDWFNDDGTQHVVLVQAVDAAGNESEPGKPLLVTRPTPTPAGPPEPTTRATPTPDRAAPPSASASTDDGGSN